MTPQQASEAQDPEKRQARGMEDVVHLFVTQPSADAPATGKAAPSREHPVTSHAIIHVARPATALGREEILQLLNANTAALESGLRAIDRSVPCNESGTIDVLAVDSLGQLVLIALEAAREDGMLLRAIAQYDWTVGHVPILRRLYQGQVINFSSQPRIFLVAPEFSPQLTCAAHRIGSPRIECYRYKGVAVPSGTAVLFEPV